MNKRFAAFVSILIAFGFVLLKAGCDPESISQFPLNDYSNQTPASGDPKDSQPRPKQIDNVNSSPATIVVGSFNIQDFGVAKLGNSDAMAIIVDIVRKFDIIAIQELRSTDQTVVPKFVELLNINGESYNYIVGPRQGYTIRKEQYIYIYDASKIELVGEPYIANDPQDAMHRSPLVASFRCRQAPEGQGFTFTILNLHIDPDDVPAEMQTMLDIVPGIRQMHAAEDDFIILGDLNSPPRYFMSFPWLQNQRALIRDTWATKPRSGRNTDNIVIDAVRTAEYQGMSGVVNLMKEYDLSVEQALIVSDHMPVWGVFSTVEAPAAALTSRQTFQDKR